MVSEENLLIRTVLADAMRQAHEPLSTMQLADVLVAAGLLRFPRNPVVYQQLRALENQQLCQREHGVRDDPNVYWRYTGPELEGPAPVDLDAQPLEDEPPPEFHGTSVGLRRHLLADEPFCELCREYHHELVDAGMATPPPPPDAAEHDAEASPPPPQ
jgi:hypothetical protein